MEVCQGFNYEVFMCLNAVRVGMLSPQHIVIINIMLNFAAFIKPEQGWCMLRHRLLSWSAPVLL
jgi:hypothetical protein